MYLPAHKTSTFPCIELPNPSYRKRKERNSERMGMTPDKLNIRVQQQFESRQQLEERLEIHGKSGILKKEQDRKRNTRK